MCGIIIQPVRFATVFLLCLTSVVLSKPIWEVQQTMSFQIPEFRERGRSLGGANETHSVNKRSAGCNFNHEQRFQNCFGLRAIGSSFGSSMKTIEDCKSKGKEILRRCLSEAFSSCASSSTLSSLEQQLAGSVSCREVSRNSALPTILNQGSKSNQLFLPTLVLLITFHLAH